MLDEPREECEGCIGNFREDVQLHEPAGNDEGKKPNSHKRRRQLQCHSPNLLMTKSPQSPPDPGSSSFTIGENRTEIEEFNEEVSDHSGEHGAVLCLLIGGVRFNLHSCVAFGVEY